MSVTPLPRKGMSEIFGTDTGRVRTAIEAGLEATQASALDAHAASGSKSQRKYTLSGTRLDHQFDRIHDEIEALGLPGFRSLPPGGPGVWYKLAYVHDAIVLPVHIDRSAVDGPGKRWPRVPVSGIVRDLFAVDRSPAPWTADTFDDLEAPDPQEGAALRAALAELPLESRLVLVPFTLTFSGITGAWWGSAKLIDVASGDLHWVIPPEELRVSPPAPAVGAPSRPAAVLPKTPGPDESFTHGDLPVAGLDVIPPQERARRDAQREAPKTEAESQHPSTQDNENR